MYRQTILTSHPSHTNQNYPLFREQFSSNSHRCRSIYTRKRYRKIILAQQRPNKIHYTPFQKNNRYSLAQKQNNRTSVPARVDTRTVNVIAGNFAQNFRHFRLAMCIILVTLALRAERLQLTLSTCILVKCTCCFVSDF